MGAVTDIFTEGMFLLLMVVTFVRFYNTKKRGIRYLECKHPEMFKDVPPFRFMRGSFYGLAKRLNDPNIEEFERELRTIGIQAAIGFFCFVLIFMILNTLARN